MSDVIRFPVTDIQRFTTRDGPGIRTTVFMKGCNLRCRWCHNPEAIHGTRELCFHVRKCVNCGACAAVCTKGRFTQGHGAYVFDADCVNCGKCAQVCPAGAIAEASRELTLEEILKTVLRDRSFYRSDGGVTVSGGEPLLQKDLPVLLRALREQGIHTAVDTAFCVPWERIEAAMPHTDLFLTDIKAINSDLHKELTGVRNELILENIRTLAASGHNFWIRIPVIPGQNSGEMTAIAAFVRSLNRPDVPVELIPYHDMAGGKYASLGLQQPLQGVAPPTKDEMNIFYRPFEGLKRVKYT